MKKNNMQLLLCVFLLTGLAVLINACGRPTISPLKLGKIVGGIEARKGSWPWQVNVRYRRSTWAGTVLELICGGSIINRRFIVTAAHCVASDLTVGKYVVVAGDHDRTSAEQSERSSEVKRLIVHPHYDAATVNNDIALIELASPLDFTEEIGPVCLPTSGSDPQTGTECVATGWGDTQAAPWGKMDVIDKMVMPRQSAVLQQVRVNVINRNTCAGYYSHRLISSSMVCAGFDQGGKDPCKADSGGPLVQRQSSGAYELVGITSWGEGCALAKKPGVYARVGFFVSWIQSNIY